MADKKPFTISQLGSMTPADLDGADLFLVSDVKDGNATYKSKKLTYGDLLKKTGTALTPTISAKVVPVVSAEVMPVVSAETERALSVENELSTMPITTDRLKPKGLLCLNCGSATTVLDTVKK